MSAVVRELLEVALDEIRLGVLLVNSSGEVLYSNPAFARIFPGVGAADYSKVLGHEALKKAIGPNALGTEEAILESAAGRMLEMRIVPFEKGGTSGATAFIKDVTEEKRLEEIKRDFVANVSHELRTPLASIKGYAETLLDSALRDGDTARKFVGIIEKHAARMTALIEDLLTLSMLESGKAPMKPEEMEIEQVAKALIQGIEKKATDKGLTLELDVRAGMPKVTLDKDRFDQVVVNLVDNAIKYTSKGGVKVSAWIEEGELRFDISDTGIGIPEKDLPRIFERFYRVDKGRSREMGGTGLGLAIVKHIIQGFKGRIWVRSEVGKGSIFSFSVPIS